MKQNLKKITLLFITAMLLVSCEKDESNTQKNETNKITRKKISLAELKNHEKIFTKFDEVSKKTKRDINNWLVIDTLFNFIIDTDNMILNQYENYTSITSPIYRINSQNNNTNTFENIVIIENFDDNSKQAFLITYNPSSDYIQSVTTNSLPAYKGEIAIQNLDYNSVDISSRVTCITYTQAICRNNGCPAGPGCFDNRDGGEHIIYETSIVCFSVNDVPVFVDMNESGTGGGESSTIYGSNSGTNNLNNTIVTEPVVTQNRTEQKLLQSFTTLEQSNWWLFVASDDTKDDIINYLNQNTTNNVVDTEALNFAIELITTSLKLGMDTAKHWFDDYNTFRNQMSNNERAIFDDLLPNRKMWYMASAYKAKTKAEELFPIGLHNGKGDAYRHALWNGLSSLLIGTTLTEQLTTAHENKPPTYTYNYKENQMDYYNNNIGRNIALFSNFINIYENVNDYLTQGYLRYLNNLNVSNLATVNSELKPTDQ